MKLKTRAADGAQVADCGHVAAAGHAVVRRGRRWVCTACSLPVEVARCGECAVQMWPGARIALRSDGRWCHRECCAEPLALVTVTDGRWPG